MGTDYGGVTQFLESIDFFCKEYLIRLIITN